MLLVFVKNGDETIRKGNITRRIVRPIAAATARKRGVRRAVAPVTAANQIITAWKKRNGVAIDAKIPLFNIVRRMDARTRAKLRVQVRRGLKDGTIEIEQAVRSELIK